MNPGHFDKIIAGLDALLVRQNLKESDELRCFIKGLLFREEFPSKNSKHHQQTKKVLERQGL